jgi:D-sedoheptulose 7-phosphate isomerase
MSEPTGFLYPFIEQEERDSATLIADLDASAAGKAAASRTLKAGTLRDNEAELRRAGKAMADRFRRGGRLFLFGNGGSATDAEGATALFVEPPWGRPLPALALVDDPAVLTALANDISFDVVFSRQLIAQARPGDMALGFSTSGDSVNVLRACEEAARRDLLTLGLAGYEGGAMAASRALQHCFVVRCDSVHRIQEVQDALVLELWTEVQAHLAGDGDG